MSRFEIKDTFYLDGNHFKVISGSFHYFRTVPEYWQDRLEKLLAMGCNTVETYIPWNVHEPQKGCFEFDGMKDITGFVRLAQKLGLYVILRPSPYICAEWEFGGLPAWLLAEDGMRLRVNYPPYMKHIREYYNVLLPKLVPLLVDNGGPVIMMQIENEYGYFATDTSYLKAMKDIMVEHGITVPFITSDGPYRESMNAGCIDGVLPTGNFGSKTEERFEILKDYTNGGHMKSDLEENVRDFDKMLELGNANIYMFEGGTNFGFMNGSNYYDELTPDVTSYDYDAVLTEDGRITEKYLRFKEVISKYREIPEVKLSMNIERRAYGRLEIKDKVSLFSVIDDISKPVFSVYTQSMEKLGQSYGYILYRSSLDTEENIERIKLWKANDRANIFIDEKHYATLYDRELLEECKNTVPDVNGKNIDILVENMGRVNFGPYLELQRKGIDHCVQINGHMHNNWMQYTLPLDNIEKLDFGKEYKDGTPAFFKFEFDADECADTFLDLEGWGKGCAFVNGFNIGRFWKIGPQKRLYIPAPLLIKGKNEIVVFETEGERAEYISLKDEPELG